VNDTKTRPGAAKQPAKFEFVIMRIFDAPRERVWKAWTEAERLGTADAAAEMDGVEEDVTAIQQIQELILAEPWNEVDAVREIKCAALKARAQDRRQPRRRFDEQSNSSRIAAQDIEQQPVEIGMHLDMRLHAGIDRSC